MLDGKLSQSTSTPPPPPVPPSLVPIPSDETVSSDARAYLVCSTPSARVNQSARVSLMVFMAFAWVAISVLLVAMADLFPAIASELAAIASVLVFMAFAWVAISVLLVAMADLFPLIASALAAIASALAAMASVLAAILPSYIAERPLLGMADVVVAVPSSRRRLLRGRAVRLLVVL